jgi:hypothetical protein
MDREFDRAFDPLRIVHAFGRETAGSAGARLERAGCLSTFLVRSREDGGTGVGARR